MTNQELEARIDATHKAMESYLGKYLLVEKNPQLTDMRNEQRHNRYVGILCLFSFYRVDFCKGASRSMSKKEEKRAARQAAARRRLRLHTFCLILAPVMKAWGLGMQGGGVEADITFPAIDTPKPLRRFIRRQCARVVKWRGLVMDQLRGERSTYSMGTQFFSDAIAKLQMVERAVEAAAPHATAYELLAMKTYITCAAIHDLMILDPACVSYPLRMLRQVLGTLADKLLPPESPLILPMNWAYYQTRDVLQEDPLWPEFPAEAYAQEKWLQEHPEAPQTFSPDTP